MAPRNMAAHSRHRTGPGVGTGLLGKREASGPEVQGGTEAVILPLPTLVNHATSSIGHHMGERAF